MQVFLDPWAPHLALSRRFQQVCGEASEEDVVESSPVAAQQVAPFRGSSDNIDLEDFGQSTASETAHSSSVPVASRSLNYASEYRQTRRNTKLKLKLKLRSGVSSFAFVAAARKNSNLSVRLLLDQIDACSLPYMDHTTHQFDASFDG